MSNEELLKYIEFKRLLQRIDRKSDYNARALNSLLAKSKYTFIEDVGANIVGDVIITGVCKLFKGII